MTMVPAVALVALDPGTALGAELAGVRFAERVTLGDTPLLLNGVGARTVTVFAVKVYVAGLYVRDRTRDANEVLRVDRPKYFVAVMKRNVSREDSAPAFRGGVERSAGTDEPAIHAEIAAFERWIPTMRDGDQLMVSFTPGTGVVVKSTAKTEAFNGSIKFGTALFGMWVGPRATDSSLRDSLLSGQVS